MTESWRKVWREGFQPGLSTRALEALRDALAKDSKQLIQGATTSPPPLHCLQDHPVEAACAISYCGWQGDDLETIGDVEEYFAKACFACDQRLNEPAGCRWFLNWFDETERDEMRRELLAEVRQELLRRYAREQAQTVALARCPYGCARPMDDHAGTPSDPWAFCPV